MAYKIEKRTGTFGSAEDAISELQTLAEEMREGCDNMSGTNLESTNKYTMYGEAAEALENIQEVEIPDCAEEYTIEYYERVNKNRRKAPSRAIRRDNATAILSTIIERAGEIREELETKANETSDGMTDADKEKVDALEAFADELQSIVDEAESVEFPGFFG